VTANPALALLYVSGLILFWLMPLIAWLLLKGQRDTGARYWFSGTASYAVVALLFVFQGADSSLVYSGATSGFSMLMVLLLIESMQYERNGRTPRWQRPVLQTNF
jgi:hypothetical protein